MKKYSFTNISSSPTRYFSQEIWCTNSEEIDLYVHEKKINSFYAFQLMIYFLAKEDFLDMHLDILLNLTPGGLNSVEYLIFFILEFL